MKDTELIEKIDSLVEELRDLKESYRKALDEKQKEISKLIEQLESEKKKIESEARVLDKLVDATEEQQRILDQISARVSSVEESRKAIDSAFHLMADRIDRANGLADSILEFNANMENVRSEMVEAQRCFQDDKKRVEYLEEKEAEIEKKMADYETGIRKYVLQLENIVKGMQSIESVKEEILNYVINNVAIKKKPTRLSPKVDTDFFLKRK